MSDLINKDKRKQAILKELIMELHDGKSVEEVQERFSDVIKDVSPMEISAMEEGLIAEGLPVQEVQRLCDVHASVFKGSLAEFHKENIPVFAPGHPIETFRQENRAIEKLIQEKILPIIEAAEKAPSEEHKTQLVKVFNKLWEIDKHYSRKENLIFPYLEKSGITAPPKVMWGVDDEIRDLIKAVKNPASNASLDSLIKVAKEAIHRTKEMIHKEDNILFPMALETLTEAEWVIVSQESDEIGYCLHQPQIRYEGSGAVDDITAETLASDQIRFETGVLDVKTLTAMINHLPVDYTFVDKDDIVKYFSQGKERIFHRTKAIIGRKVENCHPPDSVHVVEQVLVDLKSGKKDSEEFWLTMGGKFIYIQYFAVRDEQGEYLGTLEVSQDVTHIRTLEGEKRLLTD